VSGERRSPTPEQQAAIATRAREVLLEAGAGTGKTGVLVDRYCDLVTNDGVGSDAILAITFTDRAAAQLRERVRAELGRRAREASSERAREIEELLDGYGGAWITTIHGFCRRLLAMHPVAAGVDPRFRVLDASEADRVARVAFDAALEDFMVPGDPEREATVAAYRIDGLREMVFAAHEELRSRGQASPALPEPPTPDPLAALADLGRCAEAALDAKGERDHHRERLQRIIEITAQRRDRLPRVEELEALLLGASSGPREACDAALQRAIAQIAELGEGGAVYARIAELLRGFHRRFGEEKAARSGLDFEDLQLGAVDLLHSDAGEPWRRRFAHLLVDEFQDTNRLQLELIDALRGPDASVFQVGDESQSIYRFRHADLEVFRERRHAYGGRPDAEVLPLSGNFRSRPEVIATANAIGSAMLGEGFRPLAVGAVPQAPEPRGGGPAVELLLTGSSDWDEEGIDLGLALDDRTAPQYVAEARFLAARLRQLHEAGVPRNEMVVLLRAFTRVDAFEEALQRAGLRPYVVGGRGYWSEQQVADLRCLLSVIANPLEDQALLGALASPACGVRPDTLWLLRRAAGPNRHLWPALESAVGAWEAELDDPQWLAEIPPDDLERLRRFRERIAALREQGPQLGLEQLVERAAVDTGYDLAILARGSGELRLANLRKLMRVAREFEADEGRDLRAFLDFVELRSDEDDEAVAATEAEDHDGVRVMTTHTAKGLEFPVVAVADLGRGLLQGHRPADLEIGGDEGRPRVGLRMARLGHPSLKLYEREALREEDAQRTSEEECRLFYVAATRARERLLLSSVMADGRRGDLGLGTPVAERLIDAFGIEQLESDSSVTLTAPLPRLGLEASFEDPRVDVRVNLASPERARELIRVTTAAPEARPTAGGPPPIIEPAAPVTPRRPLSYSALDAYQRCGYRFHTERVLGLSPTTNGARGDRGEQLALGSAVHSLLEWSAARRWIEPPEGVARRALEAEGVEPAARLDHVLSLVGGWIGSPLRAELARPPLRLRAEVPLLVEIGGSVVRGKVDLLAESPQGPPTVVDFKTDRLDGAPPDEQANRYSLQRDLYALATSEATGAPSVRVAYVFLERPSEPVVQELDTAAIESARTRLEGIVADLASGRFEVTATPDWELCHDCPARRRLCSAPASPPGVK
jgi:ATP-dependent helicase/nuclease subunit A